MVVAEAPADARATEQTTESGGPWSVHLGVAGARGVQMPDPWMVSMAAGAAWTHHDWLRIGVEIGGDDLIVRHVDSAGVLTTVNYDAMPLRLVLAAQNSTMMAGVRGGVAEYRVTGQQHYWMTTPLVGPFVAARTPIVGRFRGMLVGGFDYFARRTQLTNRLRHPLLDSGGGALYRRGARGRFDAARIRGRLAPSLAVSPPREPESDDGPLIAAARQGDGAAFARLFHRHADAVRTRITRLVGPVAECDDLVQKVFIAFHRTLPGYRGEARLSTFLHRIAVNTAYDHLRVRSHRADSAGLPDAEALVEHLSPALEDQVARVRRPGADARAAGAPVAEEADRVHPGRRRRLLAGRGRGADRRGGRHRQAAGAARAPRSAGAAGEGVRDANGAAGGGHVVIGRRGPAGDTAQSEELERLCDRLGRVEAPFDEITRSRAEARLAAALAREPARRYRRTLGWTVALVAVGAAAAGAFVARTVVPAAASRIAGSPERSLRFEPYVVAPTGQAARLSARLSAAAASSTVPEALVQPTSRLDVPVGWLVRASLGDAITITLTGPARAWSEGADGRTVVHLDQGRLLASLESGAGRRLQIVSPGAVTDVVGTLFSVEVVGGASRVAVAHGRVQVSAAAEGSSGGQLRAAREIAAGQGWLTALPEPDALEPALAQALADHERTPPPRGASVPLSVTDAPAGAGVWVGRRRIASAPAWVLVEPHAAVRLSALAPAAAPPVPAPSPPPSTEPTLAPSSKPSPPVLEPAARATTPAGPRALLTRPGAEPTEPPPLDAASAAPEELTARTLFREADAARAKGDTALALRTLRALVERFPRESAAAAAHYELALMEEAAGSGDAALRDLAAVDTASLEEPTAVFALPRAGQADRRANHGSRAVPGRFPPPIPGVGARCRRAGDRDRAGAGARRVPGGAGPAHGARAAPPGARLCGPSARRLRPPAVTRHDAHRRVR